MIDEATRGVFVVACTPFLPDGSLDLESVDRMIDFYAEKGAAGLTILGVMGEAGKLSTEEAETFVRRTVSRTSLPVIVGVSSPGLAAMQALAAFAMDAGAAGVMVAPPHVLRTDSQIVNYYCDAAEALGEAPWVLQDFPLVTGVVMPVAAILKIIEDCPKCVMLKHEDWPGLDKISALRSASKSGARRISILCGNGGLFLPEEMLRGADGAMTGFAYPEMMVDVIASMEAGDEARARDIFDAYLPLMRYESQPSIGIAVRKHILATRGVITYPTVRKPGSGLPQTAELEVAALVTRQHLRLSKIGRTVA